MVMEGDFHHQACPFYQTYENRENACRETPGASFLPTHKKNSRNAPQHRTGLAQLHFCVCCCTIGSYLVLFGDYLGLIGGYFVIVGD
jgi:hypothetical protein